MRQPPPLGIVYLVHCVDTEGPLYESLEATFERIEKVTDLTNLEAVVFAHLTS